MLLASFWVLFLYPCVDQMFVLPFRYDSGLYSLCAHPAYPPFAVLSIESSFDCFQEVNAKPFHWALRKVHYPSAANFLVKYMQHGPLYWQLASFNDSCIFATDLYIMCDICALSNCYSAIWLSLLLAPWFGQSEVGGWEWEEELKCYQVSSVVGQ